MKEFNLTEYLKNPSQKVVTRDGRAVRIICTDVKGEYPIMALIPDKQEELAYRYLRNGRQLTYTDSPLDLCFPTIKKEGWVNLYKGVVKDYLPSVGQKVYKTKESPNLNKRDENSLTKIKIE